MSVLYAPMISRITRCRLARRHASAEEAIYRDRDRIHSELCRPGRHRDRERAAVQRDASEALEQQTATADILKRDQPFAVDVEPVFEAIARSVAAELCAAGLGAPYRSTASATDPRLSRLSPRCRSGMTRSVRCSRGMVRLRRDVSSTWIVSPCEIAGTSISTRTIDSGDVGQEKLDFTRFSSFP